VQNRYPSHPMQTVFQNPNQKPTILFRFWDITLCSALKVNRRFRGTYCLHLQKPVKIRALFPTCFTLVSCLASFWTLKMESICYSETSADFQRNTRGFMPEERTRKHFTASHAAKLLTQGWMEPKSELRHQLSEVTQYGTSWALNQVISLVVY
jgi:hypothetical protein